MIGGLAKPFHRLRLVFGSSLAFVVGISKPVLGSLIFLLSRLAEPFHRLHSVSWKPFAVVVTNAKKVLAGSVTLFSRLADPNNPSSIKP